MSTTEMTFRWEGNFPQVPAYFVVRCNFGNSQFPMYWCLVSETKIYSKAHFDYFLSKASIAWQEVTACHCFAAITHSDARAIAQSQIEAIEPEQLKAESRIIDVYAPFYAQPGKYLGFCKKAFDHLNQPGLRTVKISWDASPMDLNEFRKDFRDALNRRINSKGLDEHHFREKRISLWRDQQRLNAWMSKPYHQRKTQFGLCFETRYVAKRYPDIQQAMKEEIQYMNEEMRY
jgi:hypothetical protein